MGGTILVDDVYANGVLNEQHKLISEAREDGLLHPRCRYRPVTYYRYDDGFLPGQTQKELDEHFEN